MTEPGQQDPSDRPRESSGPGRAGTSRSRQSAPGADMLSDFQRWLLRSSAKNMRKEIGGQVRRSFGAGRQDPGEVWDTATTEIPPEVGEAPECQWCPVCRAARAMRESGPGLGGQLSGVSDAVASAAQDVISKLDSFLARTSGATAQRDRDGGSTGTGGSGTGAAGSGSAGSGSSGSGGSGSGSSGSGSSGSGSSGSGSSESGDQGAGSASGTTVWADAAPDARHIPATSPDSGTAGTSPDSGTAGAGPDSGAAGLDPWADATAGDGPGDPEGGGDADGRSDASGRSDADGLSGADGPSDPPSPAGEAAHEPDDRG